MTTPTTPRSIPVATPTDDDRSLLTVIARMTALPGKEQELRSALESLVEPTLAEDGNVNYDLHVAKDDPATFFFYENWTSSDKLDAHLANDHLVAFANRLDEFLVGGADGLVITQLQRIK
jgi:quinol monooxygenase YgiN